MARRVRGEDGRLPVLGPFVRGMNNVAHLRELGVNQLRLALNVDVTDSGLLKQRPGYSLVAPGSAHSLFAADSADHGYCVIDGTLHLITADSRTPMMHVGHQPMAYVDMAGHVWASNGEGAWRLNGADAMPWGTESPGGQPVLSPLASGSMPPGRYLVAVTFSNVDGEESGCEVAEDIELTQTGGIELTRIPPPQEPETTKVNIYLSPPNGDALYRVGTVAAATPTVHLRTPVGSSGATGRALQTLLCDRVPPAVLLGAYKGRIYFIPAHSDRRALYFTEPLRYGVYKVHRNYHLFPDPVESIAVVDDGLFVGTTRHTYWLPGTDPFESARLAIEDAGMVRGTALTLRGSAFGLDELPNRLVAVWWTTRGVLMRGDAGGVVTPLTERQLALPQYEAGAIHHRETDGLSQLISVLRSPSTHNRIAAFDRADAQVIRNGVIVN